MPTNNISIVQKECVIHEYSQITQTTTLNIDLFTFYQCKHCGKCLSAENYLANNPQNQ